MASHPPAHSDSGRPRLRQAGSPVWLMAAVVIVSAALLGKHALEYARVLAAGVAKVPLTVDFMIYRCGVQDLARPYGTCGNAEAVSGFVYPPPSMIYFKALSLLPVNASFVVHTLVALAFVGAATWMLVRLSRAARPAAWTAAIAALAIAPIGTSFAAGQVNHIVMACCVAAIYFSTVGRHVWAGAAVAAGFWLKLYPGIVPALFLPRRRWPGIIATIVITVMMALVSLLWAPPALYFSYFRDLLPHVQGFTMPGAAHSLAGIVMHYQHGGGAPVFHFVPVPPAIQLASKALLAAGILCAMAHQFLTRDSRPMESLGVMLCFAVIAAPNSWGYHYALVFPALFVALSDALDRFSWRTPLVLIGWLAMCVPDWTAPPAFIADSPLLNVIVRGRYALVAVMLIVLAMINAVTMRKSADHTRSASTRIA